RVKPSVYFKPMAQPTSNKPAIIKTSQDIDVDMTVTPTGVGPLYEHTPQTRSGKVVLAVSKTAILLSSENCNELYAQATVTTEILWIAYLPVTPPFILSLRQPLYLPSWGLLLMPGGWRQRWPWAA